MKILVLGGMHGNEMLGVRLVESLMQQPIAGVTACTANPRAVQAGTRYTETDLNRSFGVLDVRSYEERRARQLQDLVAGYDIVLDFHNTQTADNDCSFVGEGCDPELYRLAAAIGVPRCIEATYDCINKYCPNVLSVEVSVGGALDTVEVWRSVLETLASESVEQVAPIRQLYRFLRRVEWCDYERYGFNWKPFVPLSRRDCEVLGVQEACVPIFVGSHLTQYYATLLTTRRIDT